MDIRTTTREAVMASRTKDNMIAVLTDELEKKDIVVGALTKQVAAMKLCMDQQHQLADDMIHNNGRITDIGLKMVAQQLGIPDDDDEFQKFKDD